MADVIITERSRFVLSWGVFLALMSFVVVAVETRSTVAKHTELIADVRNDVAAQKTAGATRDDITRLEERIIRIESLLLAQQTRTGR